IIPHPPAVLLAIQNPRYGSPTAFGQAIADFTSCGNLSKSWRERAAQEIQALRDNPRSYITTRLTGMVNWYSVRSILIDPTKDEGRTTKDEGWQCWRSS